MNPVTKNGFLEREGEKAQENFREANDLTVVFRRICFLFYLVLGLAAMASLGVFIVVGNTVTLVWTVVLCAALVVVKKFGFGMLHFEECEKSLNEGFSSDCQPFETWLDEVRKLEEEGGDVWERHERRQRLMRELRRNPSYSKKISERSMRVPDWLK